MYRTYIILTFTVLIVPMTALISSLKTKRATTMASVGWHILSSVGWVNIPN